MVWRLLIFKDLEGIHHVPIEVLKEPLREAREYIRKTEDIAVREMEWAFLAVADCVKRPSAQRRVNYPRLLTAKGEKDERGDI